MADSGSVSTSRPSDKIGARSLVSATELLSKIASSLVMSVPSKESDDEVDGECADYFPLLGLPDELISLTFSLLPIKDRLRACVNKRLNGIELRSKHYVENLEIWENTEMSESFRRDVLPQCLGNTQLIFLILGKSYSSDCIRRLTRNVSVGLLKLGLAGSSEFHREVYKLMKDFDTETLEITWGTKLLWEVLNDSLFLDLASACRVLTIRVSTENLSPEAFHQLYEMLKEGSTELSGVTMKITLNQCIPFLGLIGISYRDGKYFSNNSDFEAFEDRSFMPRWPMRIFDGPLEMRFGKKFSRRGIDDKFDSTDFILGFHETSESLEEAKMRKGLVGVDMAPE